ncbi:hypothetical protein E1B28_013302 [Marasmius oreades]|uniref:SAC3/GANP/THP3 conserved domain-containing protein n=1 Tax=Marasmius oreades TaxID=181124 RepID=A0A9P7RPB3_9AGAR|nr:uncharacterized protein E1B28_013302 [Marasmius oreades]KAG7087326.1 hypothetical protein E1B28_013302 [Marasmius oreades]
MGDGAFFAIPLFQTRTVTVLKQIPGTKRVDHSKAVKMYERAAGDKVIPSDLRPPHVLKRTLNYLFHELLPREGFSPTFNFIRDRSRAVRSDFTMQHEKGKLAIECHERCARFHILALHLERDREGFSFNLEQQQLMNTLQSLKEFYEDQRSKYESPYELEMRVYHRFIHIRDQRDRPDQISVHITSNPVFQLTNDFRSHVQKVSSPITKTSALVVDARAMEIFGELANVLREQGNVVVIYLIACLLESLFGKDAIDDIESLRGDIAISDVIDGAISENIHEFDDAEDGMHEEIHDEEPEDAGVEEVEGEDVEVAPAMQATSSVFGPGSTSVFGVNNSHSFPSTTGASSVFSDLKATPSPFGTFGQRIDPPATQPSNPLGMTFGPQTNAQYPPASAPAFPPSNQPENSTTSPMGNAARHVSTQSSHIFNTSSTPLSLQAPDISKPNPFASSMFSSAPLAPSSQPPERPVPPTQPSQGSLFAPASGGPALTPSRSEPTLNPQATPFVPPPNTTTSGTATSTSPFSINYFPPPTTSFTPPTTTSAPSPSPTPLFLQTTSGPDPRFSVLPRLDTSPTTSLPQPQSQLTLFPEQPKTPKTPTEPPRLPRHQPISLPSTPTLPPSGPSNPRLDLLKGSLQTSNLSRSTSIEMLSPIQIQSPSVSRQGSLQNFTGLSTPIVPHATSRAPFITEESPLRGKDKGKGKAAESPRLSVAPTRDELEEALSFERKSKVVKDCFNLWRNQTADRVAYQNAVRHSESYRDKIRMSRTQRNSVNGVGDDDDQRSLSKLPGDARKRRISLVRPTSSTDGAVTPLKKRARKRVSMDYRPPRTDEELAKRLKENQEEYQRRWAPESFLQVLRIHVGHVAGGKISVVLKHWRLWLSLNPDSDATAIWMEKKFGIPESGRWASDSVFSIPILPGTGDVNGYPGIIVFECTPSDGVEDELERKYRVLDDCSRLRNILKTLPPQRYFVPSILIVWWSEGEAQMPESDLSTMLNRLVHDSIVTSFCIFSMSTSTKDPDSKFNDALQSLTLDVEGRLVRALSLTAVFRLFDDKIRPFTAEWIENCAHSGDFNWIVYGRLVQSVVDLLKTAVRLVSNLLDRPFEEHTPTFEGTNIDDSYSAYDAVFRWLSQVSVQEFRDDVIVDLRGHQTLGKVFPSTVFLDHLRVLAQYQIANVMGNPPPETPFYVLSSGVESSLHELQRIIQTYQSSLSQILNLTIRRSPKRRSLSNADSESGSKRLRLSTSASDASSAAFISRSPTPTSTPFVNGNGRMSISPGPSESVESVATDSTTSPMITVAMLRALTKDLKEKYKGGT